MTLGVAALIVTACETEMTAGRTRDEALAAADAAMARHDAAEIIGRDQLADLAAMTCERLDDGETGPEIVQSLNPEFEAQGAPMEARIDFVEVLDTLVDRHCDEHYETWRGPE